MKIVQVCPRYYPYIGGVEIHVKEISERLARKGYDVEVITTDPSGKLPRKEIIERVKVCRFKSLAPNDSYYFAPGIKKYLCSIEKDLVHAHSYHAFPALFAALAVKREKFIFTPHYHGKGHTFLRNLLHKPYKLLGARIFKKAERVICVSSFEAELIQRNFALPERKIAIIPNGLNLEEFEVEIHGNGGEDKRILYVGRLERYKGVQYLIQALPSLRDYKLEIVGKGPYARELKKMAEKLGVKNRIQWLSNLNREELLRRYKSASVLALLSPYEAYGITVAEALASGTPCVVCNSGALKEFIDNKLCVGIEYPIAIDALIIAIQNAQRGIYSKKLMGWDEVVEQIEELYIEVCKQRG
ncbi:MAG: glycosyltransferase family 4 protein [Halobacteria archaeon]